MAGTQKIGKAHLFDLMGYKVFAPEVADYHTDPSPIRVIGAPARTSKSRSAASDIAAEGMPEYEVVGDKKFPLRGSLNWSVGTDYDTNQEFKYLFEDLYESGLLEGLGATVTKAHNSPKQGNMIIVAEFGKSRQNRIVRCVWEGKSATNERSLQSVEIDNLVLSEAADHDERIWTKYLSTRYKRATLPTTPKVKSVWIHEMIQDAEREGSGIRAFTFTPAANPSYDYERFWRTHAAIEVKVVGEVRTRPPVFDEAGKILEPPGHWCLLYDEGEVRVNPACRAADHAEFAEQYLGQWTFQEGRVLPFLWKPGMGGWCNVIDADPDWPRAVWFWSFDYGYQDPYVGMLWCMNPDDGTCVIVDGFYESKLNDDQVAENILRIERAHGCHPSHYVADPKRPECGRMLRDRGFPIFNVSKRAQSDRPAGHKLLVNMLSPQPNGRPALFMHSRCRQFINEWKALHVKDGHYANEWGTTALKGRDDAFDCARYGAHVARMLAPRPEVTKPGWLREIEKITREVKQMAPERTDAPLVGRGLYAA